MTPEWRQTHLEENLHNCFRISTGSCSSFLSRWLSSVSTIVKKRIISQFKSYLISHRQKDEVRSNGSDAGTERLRGSISIVQQRLVLCVLQGSSLEAQTSEMIGPSVEIKISEEGDRLTISFFFSVHLNSNHKHTDWRCHRSLCREFPLRRWNNAESTRSLTRHNPAATSTRWQAWRWPTGHSGILIILYAV